MKLIVLSRDAQRHVIVMRSVNPPINPDVLFISGIFGERGLLMGEVAYKPQ